MNEYLGNWGIVLSKLSSGRVQTGSYRDFIAHRKAFGRWLTCPPSDAVNVFCTDWVDSCRWEWRSSYVASQNYRRLGRLHCRISHAPMYSALKLLVVSAGGFILPMGEIPRSRGIRMAGRCGYSVPATLKLDAA